jgi:hypothetical protein
VTVRSVVSYDTISTWRKVSKTAVHRRSRVAERIVLFGLPAQPTPSQRTKLAPGSATATTRNVCAWSTIQLAPLPMLEQDARGSTSLVPTRPGPLADSSIENLRTKLAVQDMSLLIGPSGAGDSSAVLQPDQRTKRAGGALLGTAEIEIVSPAATLHGGVPVHSPVCASSTACSPYRDTRFLQLLVRAARVFCFPICPF